MASNKNTGDKKLPPYVGTRMRTPKGAIKGSSEMVTNSKGESQRRIVFRDAIKGKASYYGE
jgi:hypothetical protein